MKHKINLTELVDLLADSITAGIDININTSSEVKTIAARNPKNGHAIKFTFKVPVLGVCKIVDWEETPEPVYEPED